MSDPQTPPSTPAKPKSRSMLRFGLLALLGGIAAGALGVYVIESRSGNEVADSCPLNNNLNERVNASARGEVAAMLALDRPFDATALAFQSAEGEPMTLGDLRGKTLLVNIWATWCAPCRAEMPVLDQLEAEEGSDRFAVVPINIDLGKTDKPAEFYREYDLTHMPLYRDETLELFNTLKSNGIAFGMPVTFLVDEEGCARAAMNGPAEWASPDAKSLINAFML
ncbi:TlpA family protein disulfide reductase [Aureimonas fodinaquatilis]|uniref:TlpA family protein disulfide reductase n=1 Tax=Aureimonas fodinaquatilis TaxID=2565783 RepID=A0A5B0DQ83_9HYPH|nr:TlpA disulfide reductase family protein [Aureimonas fodinaquatilis]KAA0968583.1 TlpA family protein disulfide reductase [Aureimonas fodinaquatilis]